MSNSEFVCKGCGVTFETIGQANLCNEAHLFQKKQREEEVFFESVFAAKARQPFVSRKGRKRIHETLAVPGSRRTIGATL